LPFSFPFSFPELESTTVNSGPTLWEFAIPAYSAL
jgi:hypothetical protein